MQTTRRGFLALSGSAAALTALGRVGPAGAAVPTDAGFFDANEREILGAVVARMVETGEPGAPAVAETAALGRIDALCAGLDPAITGPLPLLLRLVDWGPFLFELRFARFRELGPAEQDEALRGWMTSRLELRRLGFAALRNLSFVGYWSDERTWPLIGYRGPLIGREGTGP